LFAKTASKILNGCFTLKHNLHDLPSKPTIYVGNYPCTYLESLSLGLLPNTTIAIGESSITKGTWGKLLEEVIYRKPKNAYDDIKQQIATKLASGRSVFAYVTSRGYVGDSQLFSGRVRTGIPRIAKELGVTITPIVFDYISTTLGCITEQDFNIKVGKPMHVDDPIKFSQRLRIYYRDNLKHFYQLKTRRQV